MIHNLFPTPIYVHEPNNQTSLIQNELDSCYEYAINDDSELFSSFSLGIDRDESSRSLFFNRRNMFEKTPLPIFKEFIVEHVKNYVHSTQWTWAFDPQSPWNGNINIFDCIFYRTSEHDFRDEHTHPHHHISGVYYYKFNKDHGSIYFKNPVQTIANCQFPEGNKTPSKIEVEPAQGTLILFPSWLSHGTNVSNTKDERVTVVFNVDLIC